MQTWNVFADWASKGILSFVAMYAVHILSELKRSIDDLNKNVAQLIERSNWHSNELKMLDARLIRLEDRSHP